MQDVVVGRLLRALRRRRGWRQTDLAAAAGVSQTHVSSIERGNVAGVSLAALRRLFGALEARVEVVASWRGAELDRLLDEDHARLVSLVAGRLEAMGWECAFEVTYSEYGERGSVDVFATRPAERACLVIEVKASAGSSEATLRKMDEKARLAPRICQQRVGWRPASIGRILVMPDSTRGRNLVDREHTLRRALPADFAALRAWLRRPAGEVAGIWFLSDSTRGAAKGRAPARLRVRRPRSIGNSGS